MNTFDYLPLEEDKSHEITTEKRYRNIKKTLSKKKKDMKLNQVMN